LRHGESGDRGIDGIIKEDKLGLGVIVIQAKHWKTDDPVSRPEIQSFAGSMEGYGANKGVFITTSTFSKPAREYVDQIQRKIVLVDGVELAGLMIDHGVGVSTVRTFDLKRLDMDLFQE
jgi:restriction system protein